MSKSDYITFLNTNREQLCKQFKETPQDLTNKEYEVAKSFANCYKNNFHNILASNESRIKLKLGVTDYINANYILDKYIATQQPNVYCHCDFWNMIYQEHISAIVNLSGNNDYLNTIDHIYNSFKIELGDITYKEHVQIRNITMIDKESGKIKQLYHITMPQWPDFGVPNEDDFLKNLNAINLIEHNTKDKKMVVHCRAGVGRTGTFIMIHYLCQQFKKNNYPHVIEILKAMRANRIGMVQDKSQFLFILDVILKKLNEQDNSNCFLKIPIHKKSLSSSNDETLRTTNEKREKLSLSCEEYITIYPVNEHV